MGRGFYGCAISGCCTPAESWTWIGKCVTTTHWTLLKPYHTTVSRPACIGKFIFKFKQCIKTNTISRR